MGIGKVAGRQKRNVENARADACMGKNVSVLLDCDWHGGGAPPSWKRKRRAMASTTRLKISRERGGKKEGRGFRTEKRKESALYFDKREVLFPSREGPL